MNAPVGDLAETKQRLILGSVREVIDRIGDYVESGVEYFMFECLDHPSLNTLRLIADEVIPSIR